MRYTSTVLALFITVLLNTTWLHAQSAPIPDNLLPAYKAAVTTQEKMKALGKCFENYLEDDTVFSRKVVRLRTWLETQNDPTGVTICNIFIANHAFMREQFVNCISSALPVLSWAKSKADTFLIKMATGLVSSSYERTAEYEQAVKYWKELIPIWRAQGNEAQVAYTNNYIGSCYAAGFQGDSGLYYVQVAMRIADGLDNDTIRAFTLSTIAENYIVLHSPDLAIPYLRRSMISALNTGLDSGNIGYIYNDFAQAFIELQQYDSAMSYLNKAVLLSIATDYEMQLMRSYQFYSDIYERLGNADSANKYFRLASVLREEVIGADKVKALEAIKFAEYLRQQEITEQRLNEEVENKRNIQYAAIGVGLISLLIVFLLLSRSIIIRPRFVKLSGIVGLLLTFEFLNLLLHPFLEKITHHAPALMLLGLTGLAAILVPIHHKLEHYITTRLVEKNEMIRLAAARRIIEASEAKQKSGME